MASAFRGTLRLAPGHPKALADITFLTLSKRRDTALDAVPDLNDPAATIPIMPPTYFTSASKFSIASSSSLPCTSMYRITPLASMRYTLGQCGTS
jgi:hypothetical protein